jgi:S-adenosylmethionine:tRNA ribosyltransferase-isomerase
MDVADFDFDLPDELVAQDPPVSRGDSRLFVSSGEHDAVIHARFAALGDFLAAGDLLVLNNTRVFPARLLGRRVPSGGAAECLLVKPIEDGCWEALVHPGQKLRPGARLVFEGAGCAIHAEILSRRLFGRRTVRLSTDDGMQLDEAIDRIGHIPLPPYIKRADQPSDHERYQTVFAVARGSIAAPTAGLHFTQAILDDLTRRGIERTEVTLHVGYGTFKPVRAERVQDHSVDPESFSVDEGAARAISSALAERRRVIAVGTTTARALESLDVRAGAVSATHGETGLFVYPGHRFRVVSGLVTNFHLPRSSLLMLVAAFAGRQRTLEAYRAAVRERYRFYSYGDAMLLL